MTTVIQQIVGVIVDSVNIVFPDASVEEKATLSSLIVLGISVLGEEDDEDTGGDIQEKSI